MEYKLNDTMPFGKHKGRKIGSILSTHPEYIDWCLNNLSDFDIDFDSEFNSKIKSDVCPKCGGSGYLPEYKHVQNGICFRCEGKGYVEYTSNWASDDEWFDDEDDEWFDED